MAHTKLFLSGSTDGKGILISETSAPGNEIHTTPIGATDEIWIYGYNSHTLDIDLTIRWGYESTYANKDYFAQTVYSQHGLVLLVQGITLFGESGTSNVNAYSSSTNANKISLFGFINRIT